MAFGDKLKQLRMQAGITQEKLAASIGVTKRTIIKYEAGQTLPTAKLLTIISDYFGVMVDSLITEKDEFIAQVHEKSGSRDVKYALALVDEISGMFAGGRLSENDKDAVMKAIQNAYWVAKEESKKYTPKKYRSNITPTE